MDDPGEGSSRYPRRASYPGSGDAPPTFVYPLTHGLPSSPSAFPPPPPPHGHLPQSTTTYEHHSVYPGPSTPGFYTGHPLVLPYMAQQPMYRRSDCSHSTIVRQYCRSQLDVCDICRRHPFLGWLYQCTEDTGGYAAPIDAENGSFLSPWLSHAIDQGHYTKEQTKTIIQQKIDVLNTAEATNPASSSFPRAEGDSGIYDNNQNDEDDDEEVWAETVEEVNHLDPSSTSRSEGKRPAVSFAEPGPSSSMPRPRPRPLPCNFRCCYRCRPNFFERTWLSLNDIKDMEPLTIADLMDRPINDARVVRNLGLRRSPSPYSSSGPDDQTLGTPSLYRQQNTTGANLPELLNAQAETHTNAETEQDTSQTHSAKDEQEILIGLDSGLTTAVADTSVGDNASAEADDGN